MSYTVRVEVFEGPLDLLLHLIEKNKINIYDIPIAEITNQYLEYLASWQQFDIELASEFLLMAATLMEIKARALFPKKMDGTGASGSEEEEEDPRAELVERLLEYRRYKEITSLFQELEKQQALRYGRGSYPEMVNTGPPPLPEDLSAEDLYRSFLALLEEEPVREIALEERSLQERLREVLWQLGRRPQGLTFRQLLGGRPTRQELVLTFLVILELLRQGKIRVYQEQLFGEIHLVLATAEVLT